MEGTGVRESSWPSSVSSTTNRTRTNPAWGTKIRSGSVELVRQAKNSRNLRAGWPHHLRDHTGHALCSPFRRLAQVSEQGHRYWGGSPRMPASIENSCKTTPPGNNGWRHDRAPWGEARAAERDSDTQGNTERPSAQVPGPISQRRHVGATASTTHEPSGSVGCLLANSKSSHATSTIARTTRIRQHFKRKLPGVSPPDATLVSPCTVRVLSPQPTLEDHTDGLEVPCNALAPPETTHASC